ncbi:ABC transporter ATP-binding protein [Sedimentibacter saalensis]|uniref:ABC transporter ATP-binding protein n=1 Tax=Sedimentibacter saalensis TaxID=130788 RepID=UPI00289BCAD0|nr:ABC transporter ATP-binding protein [Sedimentibacter saalensis]
MKEISIQVENLSKIYKLYDKPFDRLKESLSPSKKEYHNKHYALNNISFEIIKGEAIGIIGVNGSGKSTLLKIITGVLTPSSGFVNVNGKISALLELGAGFNPEYSGIENIYLNGTMLGYTNEEMDTKLDSILKFADIGQFIYQPVKTYSSGMFARLAFAVAINVDPDILIVDEALSVGDVFFQAKCYNKFNEFKEKGKTILFVSHELSSIVKYCDRVVLLNSGKKIAEGSPSDMVDLYKKLLVNQLDLDGQNDDEKSAINADGHWKQNLILNPNINSYGNNMAEIFDFGLFDNKGIITNTLVKGSMFTIKMRIKFNEEIQDPIFAFTIKDLKGTDITGTNTLIEKVETSKIDINCVKEVRFKQELSLQGGEYLLSLGCTGYKAGDFVVYHRLYDVCNITVISDKNTIGFYDMNSVVEVI